MYVWLSYIHMYVGMIELLRRLIWRHNILAEEVQGLKKLCYFPT